MVAAAAVRERAPAELPAGGLLTINDLVRINTGWHQSPEAWRESSEARRRLVDQSRRLADALERQGIVVRQPVAGAVDVGLVTGQVARDEAYRSTCFLPVIAQRERRSMLNSLRYFQRHHEGGEFMRLAVVTGGRRVPLGGPLRERIRELQRTVSRWAHEANRRFGVQLFYRGTEFTTDDDGSLHPHANVIYAPRRRLPAHRWREFLSWSRGRLGAHWQDAGRLEKPDEAIKYPFKPADVLGLSAEALAWLYRETQRLKLCQPLGEFAEFRRSLRDHTVEDDEGHPVRRPMKVVMVNRPGGARLELVAKATRTAAGSGGDDERENLVLCRASPQFRFSPWAEPVVRVLGYTETPKTAEGARRLAFLRRLAGDACEAWRANGAPDPQVALAVAAGQAGAEAGAAGAVVAFKVHTSRTTVQGTGSGSPEHRLREAGDGGAVAVQGTFTDADGAVVDAETGEVLWSPAPDRKSGGRRRSEANSARIDDAMREHAAAVERQRERDAFRAAMALKRAV